MLMLEWLLGIHLGNSINHGRTKLERDASCPVKHTRREEEQGARDWIDNGNPKAGCVVQ
jgi:hypothetical protein